MSNDNMADPWAIMILFISVLILLSCVPTKEQNAPVKSLPRYSNCEYETDNLIDLDKCARRSMYAFIEQELKEFSKDYDFSHFTEKFTVSFHVETNGELTNIEIHNAADQLAKNIITKIFNSMGRWVPAEDIQGNPLRVRIAIPVKIISGNLIKE